MEYLENKMENVIYFFGSDNFLVIYFDSELSGCLLVVLMQCHFPLAKTILELVV